MNRACQLWVVGFVKLMEHCMVCTVQYIICRPQWEKKKKWLKHVLLPWVSA